MGMLLRRYHKPVEVKENEEVKQASETKKKPKKEAKK